MKIRFLICSLFIISVCEVKAQENFSVRWDLKTESTNNIDFNATNVAVFFQKKFGGKSKIANTLEYSGLKVNYEALPYNFHTKPDQFIQMQNNFEYLSEITEKTKFKVSIITTANFQNKFDFSDITVMGNLSIVKS